MYPQNWEEKLNKHIFSWESAQWSKAHGPWAFQFTVITNDKLNTYNTATVLPMHLALFWDTTDIQWVKSQIAPNFENWYLIQCKAFKKYPFPKWQFRLRRQTFINMLELFSGTERLMLDGKWHKNCLCSSWQVVSVWIKGGGDQCNREWPYLEITLW